MAENVELFDLSRPEFEDQARAWCLPSHFAATETPTMGELRRAIGVLAVLIWTLGQKVKKLEKEE